MSPETTFILDWRQISERTARGWLDALKQHWFFFRRYIYSRYVYDLAVFLHWAGAKQVLGGGWRRWSRVVPMGVDDQFLKAAPPHNRTPKSERLISFLYIGSIARVRQLELLLDAAKILCKKTTAFELVFLGRDSSQGYYAKLTHQLGLDHVVSFHPSIPYAQVPEAVLAHDVTLAYVPNEPADWQYHPTLKVLEYRALGIPIIATNFLPNQDEVKDRVNGLLVENNAASFAAAMQRFVDDPAFLADCTTNAQRMRRGLLWPEVAVLYEQEVYNR